MLWDRTTDDARRPLSQTANVTPRLDVLFQVSRTSLEAKEIKITALISMKVKPKNKKISEAAMATLLLMWRGGNAMLLVTCNALNERVTVLFATSGN